MRLAEEVQTRGYSPAVAQRARESRIDRHGALTLSDAEIQKFDVERFLRSVALRDVTIAPFEREISSAVDEKAKFVVDGAALPLGVLVRDFSAGSASQAGNLTGHAPRLWERGGDALRNASAATRLGVPVIAGFSGSPVIPRLVTAPTGAALGEVAATSPGTATSDGKILAPKRVSAELRVSLLALTQPGAAGGDMIRRNIVSGLAAELDRQFFNGAGGDEVFGLRSTSGVAAVVGGSDGGSLTYARLADMENAVSDSTESAATGFAVNKATRRYLRTLSRGTNLPFVWESSDRPLLGHRAVVSNNLPANLAKGSGSNLSALAYANDWGQALVAVFGEAVGVTVDRYTLVDSGQVRIIATLYADIAFLQPGAFCVFADAILA